MYAEWTAECGHEDPVVVVPWADPDDAERRFIDLRENPYDLDLIPEAVGHPALEAALRSLNAPRSPVFTAKCDVWLLGTEEIAPLHPLLDVEAAQHPAGFGAYIDLFWRERSVFVSRHAHGQMLDRLVRRAEALELPLAALELTLRPALLDLTTAQEGFAVTLYVKAVGPDRVAAEGLWAQALEALTPVLRSRELTPG